MVWADQLQTAADELKRAALEFADQLDKSVISCNKAKVVSSGIGLLASVVMVGAGTAVSVLSCGAAAPLAMGGAAIASASTIGTAAVDLGLSYHENVKMKKIQEKWEDFIRLCQTALRHLDIGVEEIKLKIESQAKICDKKLEMCTAALAIQLSVMLPLRFWAAYDCRRTADQIASHALSNSEGLVNVNWAKLLETIWNHPIVKVNTGLDGISLYHLVKAAIALQAGERSKVGNVFRDLASFLEEISESGRFLINK